MKTLPMQLKSFSRAIATALVAWSATFATAFPIITNVIETGGDNEATDTVPAKWTGVKFSNGIAGEFLDSFTVPFFGEDVPAYVDRTHQWNGATLDLPLPSYLVGGEYIMIGNDNRDNADLKLEVTVSEPALVYVLVDNRLSDGSAGNPPDFSGGSMAWLLENGWTAVTNALNRTADASIPDEVGVDEGGNGTGPGGDIQNWSSVYVKSVAAGTFTLLQSDNGGRNMYGVVVTTAPGSTNTPPQITNLSPANNSVFHDAAAGVTFVAATTAPNRIANSNVSLTLNGTNISNSLVFKGTPTQLSVTYTNLRANTIYSGRVVVADQAGRGVTNIFSFDTFTTTTSTVIEAEDYNLGGGQTVTNPAPGAFANQAGVPDVDYHDVNSTITAAEYRTADFVGIVPSTDAPRQSFTTAGAKDFQVNSFLAGDWMNYTRNLGSTLYNVYLRVSAGTAQQIRLDKVDASTNTLGIFNVPSTSSFAYVPLIDVSGSPVAVQLSGNTMLRLTGLASANPTSQLNFLLLTPAPASLSPYVSMTSPGPGANDVPLDAIFSATIANATALANGSVAMRFGPNVVAPEIKTSGDTTSVNFDPPGLLTPGMGYPIVLSYKDTSGLSYTNTLVFNTIAFKPIITSVGETDGDDSVNASAQFSGQTFVHPNLGLITLGRFMEDAPAYRSRTHQWNGASTTVPLPPYLVGGEYIMVMQENRDNVPYQLDVTVSEPALVYLLVDNRLSDTSNANPPDFSAGSMSWLVDGGWTAVTNGLNRTGNRNVPDEVGMDEAGDGVGPGVALNQWASVYVKSVPAGKFTLFQADNSGNNMYGVVVRSVASTPFKPAVTITTPALNASFPASGATVTIAAEASVQNSTVSKVEFFAGTGIKIGEDTDAPFTFIWNNPEPGRYALTAKATAATGESSISAPISIVVGKVTSINFQAASAETPAGYLPDLGDIYGDRGNGFSYGWDDDNTANARDRNSVNSPNELYDTFNHLQKPLPAGRVWEIGIPNGRYKIYAVSGDPDNTDSVFDVQAEGVTFLTGTPTASTRFFEGTGRVNVTDGKMTISNGPTASNSKINFIEIAELPAETAKPTFGKITFSGNTLTLTWTGTGTLQEAASITGPWTNVTGNPSGSLTVQTTEARKFYRLVP
jgi:hypothetical protein